VENATHWRLVSVPIGSDAHRAVAGIISLALRPTV
jgi:hypothetical protein